jgi:hypothetical protein
MPAWMRAWQAGGPLYGAFSWRLMAHPMPAYVRRLEILYETFVSGLPAIPLSRIFLSSNS